MAITLKDLNLGLEKQQTRDKVKNTKETISIAELRKLLGQDTAQEELLESIESKDEAIVDSMSKQVKQAEDSNEVDSDILDELRQLVRLNKDVKESLIAGWSGKDSKAVFEKAGEQPTFKSVGERLGDWKKQTFSTRGIAQSVLGVKSGGIIDTMLAKREHKKQSIQDYMKTTGVDRKTAESEYNKFQELQKSKRSVSEEYNRIKQTYGEEAADKTAVGRKYRAVGKAMGSLGIFGLNKEVEQKETASRKEDTTSIAEKTQEADRAQSIETDIDKQQLDVQTKMLDSLERIYKTLGGIGSKDKEESDGLDVPVGGGLLKKVGNFAKRGLSKVGGMARSAIGVGRMGLAAIGTGTAATVAAGVGGALLAGYAGKKFREHVEEKEATNRAQEQEEISTTKIDVETLKQLPDDGKAISPGDINKVDRARNLMEQRVEAKQTFTEEEATLAKVKLGVVVPKELISSVTATTTQTNTTNETAVTPTRVSPDAIKEPKTVSGSGVSQVLAPPTSTANAVYGASADNAGAATTMGAGTTNNVVAPTTINNTTTQSSGFKPDVRNQDSSFKRMLDSRYVPV